MNPSLAWIVNPRRRRTKARKAGKRRGRSAAQRAATARMLAANRSRRGGSHRSYARNPSKRRRSVARRGARRGARRASVSASGAIGMLKDAGVMGAGAVAVDVGMGYLGRVLPSAASPVNADGTTNWLYFTAKTGLAIGLGTYGRRFLPGGWGPKMGEGALAVLAYQIMRGLVPSGVALGGVGAYFNPAPTMRPQLAGSGRGGASFASLRGSATGGASLGVYEGGDTSAIRAANVVRMGRR